VIVANAHAGNARAILGGAVGMFMAHRGVAGLIVDGAVRDVAEFRALGFPVMARSVTPRSGTSLAGWGEVNIPVACGGVVVQPGDIVVGDEEGIVVVERVWAKTVVAMLGNTGHTDFQPDTIRDRLAAIPADAPLPKKEAIYNSLKTRGGVVIDACFGDDDPAIEAGAA